MERLTDKPSSVFDWLRERSEAYRPTRGVLERDFCEQMLRVEGIQWLAVNPTLNRIDQIRRALDIDDPNHRPVLNLTARFVQQKAASTSVREFDCEVLPPERDVGVSAPQRAQAWEDLLNLGLQDANVVPSWNAANDMRAVTGVWGMGLFMKPTVVRVAGAETLGLSSMEGRPDDVADSLIRSFDFNPIFLTLDPAMQALELDAHESVVYSSAWSLAKAKRVFGDLIRKGLKDSTGKAVDLNENGAFKTIGELQPFETQVNRISSGRLYSSARYDSQTKGVLVHEIYRKEQSMDRFDTMEVVLELPGGAYALINEEMRESPWGGCGMPLRLLHGYRRSESMWSISDAKMMKDHQDNLNHVNLMTLRQLRHASKEKWLVDEKAFGASNTPESIANRFTNAIMGIIPYNSGSDLNRANPPQLVGVRAPDAWLSNEQSRLAVEMREQIHRAAINQGQVSTHTPLGAYQLALEQSGQPADRRIYQDRMTAQSLCHTLLGTMVRLVESGSPTLAKRLVDAGFNEIDLGVFSMGEKPLRNYRLLIREGSIRQRSLDARVAMIREDASKGLLENPTYQRIMSESGIDMPLSEEDAAFSRWSGREAEAVMFGKPFVPAPAGAASEHLIRAMQRAIVDRRCDDAARQRLTQAIQMQRLSAAQEAAMLDQAMNAGATGGEAPQEPAPGAGDGVGIDQILAALQAQGAEGSAPRAVA